MSPLVAGLHEATPGFARDTVRRFGFDIVRYPERHPASRRVRLLRHHGIDLVFDVGANVGQYALELRRHGYTSRIISFEPLASAFEALSARADTDPDWIAISAALGDKRGSTRINIAANSQSSSLLEMLPAHENADVTSGYIGTEIVSTVTLDSLLSDQCPPNCRPFLKIDTQGYEHRVLAGARFSLPRIIGVQLEMSLVELYAGSMLFREATETMMNAGFAIMGIDPGFADRQTGRLLQCDGIFFRTDA